MTAISRAIAAFLCAAIISLSSAPALAQNSSASIVGSVVDQRNALPIDDAVVVVSQNGTTVQTVKANKNGTFRITGLNPGIYTISIRAQGYDPTSNSDIAVASGSVTTLNSSLFATQTSGNSRITTIGTVSTSASAALQQATTISQSVDPDLLLRTGQIRVADALENLPSLNVGTSSSPGDDVSVNIRGLGSSETAALLNGHPIGPLGVDAPDGFNYADTPSFGLTNVTVTYGSGAQGLYGSDTIAGAVNFQTIQPTVKPEFNFLQSLGGFGRSSTGISATGTYGKIGYAFGTAVQGLAGSFNGGQVFQSARPDNLVAITDNNGNVIGGSAKPPAICSNIAGNDVSACNQAAETYAVSSDTKLTSEIGNLKYNFSNATSFEFSFYSAVQEADSTGNGDNDNLPYASRLAYINGNLTPNCNGNTGYTVITNPISGTTGCYSAQQWAAASSGPDGGGSGRSRSASMRDYDFDFKTVYGINNINIDYYINNYDFEKNSAQAGGLSADGLFLGTPDYTDYFNTHGYLISDDIVSGKNDLGFGYSLINQLQTSFGSSASGAVDPVSMANYFINIPDYNFPAAYFSEGSVFLRDNYTFNNRFSIFANAWEKRSSVTQKTTFDPRVTALVRPTRNDVFRLTYGRSDGAPAPVLKQVGIVQVTDPGASLTSVTCNNLNTVSGSAGNPNLTSEDANDFEAGYGHRFQQDSNIQVNAYVTDVKNQLISADEPVTQFGLGNLNFQGNALNTYIARLNAAGCLGGGVNSTNVYQFLSVPTTYNLGNQLARGIEISGRERFTKIAYIDYGYYIESSQSFNIPNSVLVNNPTEVNGGQVLGVPLHQATISLDVQPGPWDFRIDNYYTDGNNPFDRPAYWHSDAFISRSFNHGTTLLTLGGTNIFNQAVQIYGYIGQGVYARINPVFAAANPAASAAANGLQEYVNGVSSNEEFGLQPAQLTLTLTQKI